MKSRNASLTPPDPVRSDRASGQGFTVRAATAARTAIHALVRAVAGHGGGEIARSAVIGLLVAAIVVLAQRVAQLSRSPNPREWNCYTPEANAHLYEGPNVVSPRLDRSIAHAGGEYRGIAYSNSLEALNANYARGLRLFEMDLSWTSDEQLAAIHDWHRYTGRSRNWFGPPTLEEFAKDTTCATTPTTLFMVYR